MRTLPELHLPASRQVVVHGDAISYEVHGEGEPVVLVHGLSGSSRWWARNVPALAKRHRVFLLDLPGFGASRHLRRRFILAKAAEWLLAWVDAVGLECIDLVGHSMGGFIAIRAAAARPDLIRRLVLVAPAGVPNSLSVAAHSVWLARAIRHMTPTFLPTLAYDAARAGPRTVLRAALQLLADDIRPALGEVTAPTLLVWGDRDALVPARNGQFLRDAIPDSRLVILEGSGHVPMWDRPAAFNRVVLRFLDDSSLVRPPNEPLESAVAHSETHA